MATVAKDQQVPHDPWAFTGVMTFSFLQSKDDGEASFSIIFLASSIMVL